MSAKGSCPDRPPQVGDRQVDTLTSYTLRTTAGAAQPRADAWLRLRARLQAGTVVAARREPTLLDRAWSGLLLVGPRLSTAGIALAMFALFVHSSLVPLAPPVSDSTFIPASSVPAIKLQRLDTAGVMPVSTPPVFSPDQIRQQRLAQDIDPTPNLHVATVPVEMPDPTVPSHFVGLPSATHYFQADPLPHY